MQNSRELLAAYRQTFSTDEGRIVLQDLVSRFGYTRTSTCPADYDPNRCLAQENQRIVVMHIGRMIDGDFNEEQPKEGEL